MDIIEKFKIPLKNKNSAVIDYAYVDEDIYESASCFSWSLDIKTNKVTGKENKYAAGWIGNTKIYMHQFVMGKSHNVNEVVIDHINNNGLDNRYSNLRHSTLSANSQNCNRNIKNKSSIYLGVSISQTGRWRARHGNVHIGVYDKEIEAAKSYDEYILIKYGKTAKTNNLINYELIKDKKLKEKNKRELPTNITYYENKYRVKIIIDKTKYDLKLYNTLEEAINVLNKFKEEKKIEKENKHLSKIITKNDDNIAFIKASNSNNEILVDEESWHLLNKCPWIVCEKGYAKSKSYMHRIIINAKSDEKVDHINRNKLDNRRENLRISTSAQNNHNRTKSPNATSKYYGVCLRKSIKKWETYVTHNKKKHSCGYFDDEIQAAKAYNKKAIELYGEYANLNHFDDNEDSVVKNLSEVFENINING